MAASSVGSPGRRNPGTLVGAVDYKTKNLLFLLGAAPMGMAGCLSSADDSDTLITLTTFTTFNNEEDTTGDGDSGDGDGDTTPGDGDGEPGDGDGDTSPGDGDGDTSPGDGDGDGDTSGDGDGDTTGGSLEDLCLPFSEHYGDCYGAWYMEDGYASCYSGYASFMDDPVCFSAWEAWIVCLIEAPCGELFRPVECAAEDMDFQDNCL
jgi:hypothetical protein